MDRRRKLSERAIRKLPIDACCVRAENCKCVMIERLLSANSIYNCVQRLQALDGKEFPMQIQLLPAACRRRLPPPILRCCRFAAAVQRAAIRRGKRATNIGDTRK